MESKQFEIKSINDFATIGASVDTAENVDVIYEREGKLKTTKDYKGIYNIDRKELAGIVSSKYAIIQHRDVIDSVGAVIDKLGMAVHGNIKQYENVLRGEMVFMDQSIPLVKDGEQGIRLGFRFTNSYDRSTSFRLEMYGFRLICSNGMVLGHVMNNIKEITLHVGQKPYEIINTKIEDFIHNVINSSTELQAYVSASIADTIAWKSAEQVLDKIMYSKKHAKALKDILMEDNKNMKKLTRWDLYNALTKYTSHNKLSKSAENWIQIQSQRILTTSSEKLIQKYIEA